MEVIALDIVVVRWRRLRCFQILSIEYPAYIQKKSAAQAVYDLELEEIKKGSLQIANSAANPNSDPETDSLDPLPFINGQQVMGTKLDELAALQRKYRAVYTKYLEELLKSTEGLIPGHTLESTRRFSYMIEIIQTYSNQIVMIITAITPALAAIAALIMIIRKTNSSNETMISESREMRKQSSAIRT